MAATTIADSGLDRAGVAISAVCLVHCPALPLIAAALPAVDAWVDAETHHRIHWALLALALPISLAALITGVTLLAAAHVANWRARHRRSGDGRHRQRGDRQRQPTAIDDAR